jgi:hypothetical protein
MGIACGNSCGWVTAAFSQKDVNLTNSSHLFEREIAIYPIEADSAATVGEGKHK